MNTKEQNNYLREYRKNNKERLSKYRKNVYWSNIQESRRKSREYSKVYYQRHKSERAIYRNNYRQRIKTEVLTYYGNGKCACVRCSYSNIDALSIDHLNGNGGEHRSKIGNSIYLWLRKNNYPIGYQTLCMNCQYIKREENRER